MAQEPVVRDVFDEDEAREAQQRGNEEFEVVLADEEGTDDEGGKDGKDDTSTDDGGKDEGEDGKDRDEDTSDTDDGGKDADDERDEEDEEATVEAEADAEDEDLTDVSRQVRKRIMRERRIRRHAEEAAESERVARIAAQRENLATQKQFVDFMVSGLELQINSIKQQLAIAKEAGDSPKEVELLSQLTDLTSKKRSAEEAKARVDATRVEESPTISPEARRWMANNRWFNHPRFTAETSYVRQLDQQLSSENRYRAGSAEYMRELDRRVNEQLPDVRRRAAAVFRTPERKPAKGKDKEVVVKKSPTAPVSRSATTKQAASSAKRRIVIPAEEQEMMRQFKLDPSNREHVEAWARERLSQERSR